MNWIQLRPDHEPLNTDQIIKFSKCIEENDPAIVFFTLTGYSFLWHYRSMTTRDEDYQTLIELLYTNRRTHD